MATITVIAARVFFLDGFEGHSHDILFRGEHLCSTSWRETNKLIKGRKGSLLDQAYRAFQEDGDSPSLVCCGMFGINGLNTQDRNPYYFRSNFSIHRSYTTKSLEGFGQYAYQLNCSRINAEQFKAARMLDASARRKLGDEYHKKCFCLTSRRITTSFISPGDRQASIRNMKLCALRSDSSVQRWATDGARNFADNTEQRIVFARKVVKNGCEVEVPGYSEPHLQR